MSFFLELLILSFKLRFYFFSEAGKKVVDLIFLLAEKKVADFVSSNPEKVGRVVSFGCTNVRSVPS